MYKSIYTTFFNPGVVNNSDNAVKYYDNLRINSKIFDELFLPDIATIDLRITNKIYVEKK